MMGATSALPRNGRLPGVGSGREAMADDAHGVDFVKIVILLTLKKRTKGGGDVTEVKISLF